MSEPGRLRPTDLGAALQLLAMTFVRPGELSNAEWAEFNLDAAIWTIPAGRLKMSRPRRVPQAL